MDHRFPWVFPYLEDAKPPNALLGQVGFFDQFTVTMSRLAMILVVEEVEEVDRRFGIAPAEPPPTPPRFSL